jgi:hypothetical protein
LTHGADYLEQVRFFKTNRARTALDKRMTTIEDQILSALNELDAAVKTMATATRKPSLLPLFIRIEQLAEQLPPEADLELRHFLTRKSYEKARQKLQGRASARGSCGS